jgi:UDP-glucose 4-epimerase
MQPKRILVTGGGGFIGKHLIERLLSQGHTVSVLDIVAPAIKHQNLNYISGSFLHSEVVVGAIKGMQVLYHLAATKFPQNANAEPIADISENIVGSAQLFQLAVENGLEKTIFCSSGGAVYGETNAVPIREDQPTIPIAAYGMSKLAVENYLRFFGRQGEMQTVSLRVANPYGPKQNINNAQGALTTFCAKAIREEKIEIWGDGSVERDYIFIADVIDAFVACLDTDLDGRPINIGSGVGLSLNEIIQQIRDVQDTNISVQYFPGRAFDVPKNFLDISRAKEILNWSPKTDLSDGIRTTLDYIKENANKDR